MRPRQIWPEELARIYRSKGYWRGETFPQMLRERASAFPGRIAVVGGNERWSYSELHRRAETAAAGFIALGLKPGERVIVQIGNRPEFVSVVFGLFCAGLIPVFALPAHRRSEIAHFAERAEAAAYVVADHGDGFDYRVLAREVKAQLESLIARARATPARAVAEEVPLELRVAAPRPAPAPVAHLWRALEPECSLSADRVARRSPAADPQHSWRRPPRAGPRMAADSSPRRIRLLTAQLPLRRIGRPRPI